LVHHSTKASFPYSGGRAVRPYPADLVLSITENDNEDWSFEYGRAQFPTDELQGS
jgi:hypothetical protein